MVVLAVTVIIPGCRDIAILAPMIAPKKAIQAEMKIPVAVRRPEHRDIVLGIAVIVRRYGQIGVEAEHFGADRPVRTV